MESSLHSTAIYKCASQGTDGLCCREFQYLAGIKTRSPDSLLLALTSLSLPQDRIDLPKKRYMIGHTLQT